MVVAQTLWNRRIPTRDGIALAADILLPPGEGPFPTVVLRTPYARGRAISNPKGWIRLVANGYALVAVDQRGRNDSEGEWIPWVKDSQDGCDVVQWITGQSWCAGKVGMVGGSYNGLTQWWTAVAHPPGLACIVPFCIGGVSRRLPFGTGVPAQYWLWWMNLVHGRTQQYPGAPAWEAWMTHTPLRTLDASFGLSRSAWQKYVTGEIEFFSDAATLSAADYSRIDVPVLIGVGWWDDQEAMRAWCALQAAKSAGECRLLIGAWDHIGNTAPRPVLGGIDVSSSVIDTIAYVEQFLAQHLKGSCTSFDSVPRCKVFLTGASRWDHLDTWPDPRALETPMYLTSDGDARSLTGNGRLVSCTDSARGADTFVYDPNDPARDMSNLAVFGWADPPLDQRYLQRRKDSLVYTSKPFETPVTLSGQFRLCVFVSSDRPDTDLFVTMSDVHPDGRSIGLTASNELPACLRLRYRNGVEPELLTPGRIYEVTIDGSWLHHVFKPRHRLRLVISSGNFPVMARNAGSGRHWADDEILYAQTNTIYHSSLYPSRVILPLVPQGER